MIERAASTAGLRTSKTAARPANTPVFSFIAPLSFWSMGEEVIVLLRRDVDGILLDIMSRSASRLCFVDWGKNRRNVYRLMAALDASSEAAFMPLPICPTCGMIANDASSCVRCGRESLSLGIETGWQGLHLLRVGALILMMMLALIGVIDLLSPATIVFDLGWWLFVYVPLPLIVVVIEILHRLCRH